MTSLEDRHRAQREAMERAGANVTWNPMTGTHDAPEPEGSTEATSRSPAPALTAPASAPVAAPSPPRSTRRRCAAGECRPGPNGACIHCLAPARSTNATPRTVAASPALAPPAGRFDDDDAAIDALERAALQGAAPVNGYPAATREQLERNATDGAPWQTLVTSAPAEWYSEAPPHREWLLRDARHPKARGVFPLGKVGQLIAEGGAGKTLALCQLAVAVATGTTWLGTFEATRGRVLLVLGEEDTEEARRRLHNAANVGQGPRPEPGAIEVLPLAGAVCAMLARDERGNAMETEFLRWLRTYVEAGAFRLVVVDPLSRFAGPDAEKDNAVATRFVQALESLAAPDRSILNAHHVNKLSRGAGGTVDGSSGRGSSAFVDGARWQCGLSVERIKLDGAEEQARLGEVVTFDVTKSNYAAKPDPVILRRNLDHGGALVPVDGADIEAITAARGKDPARGERRRVREAEQGARDVVEDDAVIQAVRERPGIPLRDLAKRVQAIAHCGANRAEVAIARTRSRLDVREGPRMAKLHYLPGTDDA